MRITVECGGFSRAADACLAANQTCAVLTSSLADRLSGSAGMAGDDATSTTFAASYDTAARAALAALIDLTHAFIGAGRLLAATGDNHRRAEAAAAGRVATLGYGGRLHDDAFVRLHTPSPPPSSLGAQEPSIGIVDRWILDQVEGFAWPSADLDGLRTAASAWRRAAASTAGLADHVDAAVALVEQQRSPEVPLAVDALTELTTVVGDTAWQLGLLATACEEHADAVELARDRTRALLTEIGQVLVEGVAVAVLVAGLSGGLGGGAALAAAAARVRAQAPRFFALLTALRAGAAAAAARTERVADDLADLRARLEKFVRVPARDEVGSIKHPAGWFPERKPGWLRRHEVPPGHTIERHVGKSEPQLRRRLDDQPKLQRASAFDDEASAERFIERLLQLRASDIDAWMAGSSRRLTLTEDLGVRTGVTVRRDGSTTAPTAVRVVLVADDRTTTGWRILTAFPH